MVEENKEDVKLVKTLKYETFARNSVATTGQYTIRPRSIQRPALRRLMKNPYLNWETLQGISSLAIATNGNYARLVRYFGTMAQYDHILYPSDTCSNKTQKKESLQKSYLEACKTLEKMNLKYNCRWWGKRLIEQGELFLYKLEDKKGIIYQEIPTYLCRANRVENGVIRYEMDFARIDSNLLSILPMKIKSQYIKWSENPKEGNSNWQSIDDNGVCFNMWGDTLPHGIPFLTFLFDKILAVEDFEDMNEDLTKAENLKLIHQTIPTNSDGELLMEETLARQYHESTKKNLPKGVTIATNPLKMEAVNLQTSGNENARGLAYVQNALKSVYDTVGVNINLFNGETTNNIILEAGIIADAQIVTDMILMFQNYINLDLKKNKIKGIE